MKSRNIVDEFAPHLSKLALIQLGADDFIAVPNFISAPQVDILIAYLGNLREQAVSTSAAIGRGTVEWFKILPQDVIVESTKELASSRGKLFLFELTAGLQASIEGSSDIQFDSDITEMKFAFYPTGGYYQRHLDAMNVGGMSSREYSFIIYLNKDWIYSDGGHLRVYGKKTHPGTFDVAPAAGTIVVFRSTTISHEVMPTSLKRVAIVGWFNRKTEGVDTSVDGNELSPLALEILRHYRERGEAVRITSQ